MQRLGVFLVFLLLLILNGMVLGSANVAVLELEADGVSASDARILTARLRSELIATKEFGVVERDKMEEILKEQGFQQTGCTSSECVVEAGQLIGVEKIVAGSIGKIGSIFLIGIRLVDVETGKIESTVDERTPGYIEDVVETGIHNAARRMAGLSTKTYPRKNVVDYSSRGVDNFFRNLILRRQNSSYHVSAKPFLNLSLNGRSRYNIDKGEMSSGAAIPAFNQTLELQIGFGKGFEHLTILGWCSMAQENGLMEQKFTRYDGSEVNIAAQVNPSGGSVRNGKKAGDHVIFFTGLQKRFYSGPRFNSSINAGLGMAAVQRYWEFQTSSIDPGGAVYHVLSSDSFGAKRNAPGFFVGTNAVFLPFFYGSFELDFRYVWYYLSNRFADNDTCFPEFLHNLWIGGGLTVNL